jgi:hypothetical protein
LFDIPKGGISDTPILVSLLHALNFSGPFSSFKQSCSNDPARNWIVQGTGQTQIQCNAKICLKRQKVTDPISLGRTHLHSPCSQFAASPGSSLAQDLPAVSRFPDQRAFLKALSVDNKVCNMGRELHEKVKITLQPFAPFDIPVDWWDDLYSILRYASPFIKLCWLKTVCGAWCTSVRLHTVQNRPCVFGCLDSSDELCHYLACPILLSFTRATLRIQEESFMFLPRLCISDPSSLKLKALAFSHALYHQVVNDAVCMAENNMPRASRIVQTRASEICNYCLHLVGGREG